MEFIKSLDTWLAIVVLGFAVYFLLWKDRIQPIITALLPSHTAPGRPPTAEIEAETKEIISDDVSSIETPNTDAEMISLRAILKLVDAGLVTETAALKAVFGVNAGGSKEYKRIQAKLKTARESTADPQ